MSRHSFDPEVAKIVGINAAVIFENIVFWIEKNEANGRHEYEGRTWTYNSRKAFLDLFPYLTEKQIRAALDRLRDADLVSVGNFNETAYDRTLWYALTDKSLGLLRPFHRPPEANPLALQGQPIPDNKPYTKPDHQTDMPGLFSEEAERETEETKPDLFDEFWKEYPKSQRKVAKPQCRKTFWDTVHGKRKGVDRVSAETIIRAARAFAASNPDPQFVPAPLVWLNQCRWEAFAGQDEPTNKYREMMRRSGVA